MSYWDTQSQAFTAKLAFIDGIMGEKAADTVEVSKKNKKKHDPAKGH